LGLKLPGIFITLPGLALEMAVTKVSIIIVSWNVRQHLDACLKSIRAHNSIESEIIVVDNASSDDTLQFLRKNHPDINVIASEKNLGFSAANNIGIAVASGGLLLFLNPDTLMREDVIGPMLTVFEKQRGVGCVGCKLTDENGQIDFHCAKRFPTISNMVFEPYFRKFGSTVVASYTIHEWDHLDSREVPCLSGACLMVRRSVLEQIGDWNENIFMYVEDVDLCWRASKAGWSCFYLADAAIVHFGQQSTNQNQIMMHAESVRSMRKFFIQQRSFLYGCVFEAITVIDFLFKYLLFSIQDLFGKKRMRQSIRLYRQLAGELLKRP
jgi:GT2 family glycosyltransferase